MGCDIVDDTQESCLTELDITGVRLSARPGLHATDEASWGYVPGFGSY